MAFLVTGNPDLRDKVGKVALVEQISQIIADLYRVDTLLVKVTNIKTKEVIYLILDPQNTEEEFRQLLSLYHKGDIELSQDGFYYEKRWVTQDLKEAPIADLVGPLSPPGGSHLLALMNEEI